MKTIIKFIRLLISKIESEIFKTTKAMGKYVARKNSDGTVDLYGTTAAIGVDFSTVNVLVLDTTNVDVQKLQSDLATAQAYLSDLQDKVNAINAVEA